MNITKFNNIAYSQGAKYFLTLGEDDSKMKSYQFKKAKKSILKKEFKYSSSKGENYLLKEISQKENVSIDNIVMLSGSTLGIFYFFLMMNKKDKILLFKPVYPLYTEIAKTLKTSVKTVNLDVNNFNLTYKLFLNSVSNDIKYVIINNPHNPTGKIIEKKELDNIIKYCEDNKIYLLLDEVYEEIVYVPFEKIVYDNYKYTILLKSFSKMYNMTGIRLAYLIADIDIISKFENYIKISMVSIPKLIQDIGYSSLKKEVYVKNKYEYNRDLVASFLYDTKLKFVSLDSTFYVYINIKEFGMKSYDFCLGLISYGKVALLPGVLFGNDNYVRLTYSINSKTLSHCLNIIKDYISSLR